MRNIVGGVCTVLLLWGCGMDTEQKKLMAQYEHEKRYHSQLLKTEKIQLHQGDETKALLTATYLAPSDKERHLKNDEVFIVGFYTDEENEHLSALQLSLDGVKPKSILPLNEKDPRLKEISFVIPWNRFFLVTFPHMEKEKFDLTFYSGTYGEGVMHFAKRAKYTFTQKAF